MQDTALPTPPLSRYPRDTESMAKRVNSEVYLVDAIHYIHPDQADENDRITTRLWKPHFRMQALRSNIPADAG